LSPTVKPGTSYGETGWRTKEDVVTEPTDHAGVIAPPPVLYAGALIASFVLRRFWPAPISGGATWVVLAGVALGLLGVGLVVWGLVTMRSAGTNVDPRKETTAIVADGPFRVTRNPLYVGLTLIYLGLTLGFDVWWGLVLLVPLLIVMHFGVVCREERYLERKFGDDYRQYKRRVARYIG
jgi:protein-S-isoprenylcysteine O-methyltransferase Ste14